MATATPEERARWPAPNYVNPESRGPIVIGITAATMALVIVFQCARFYGKGVLRQALGADDWTMLIATIFSIPVSVFAMVSCQYGLGLHIWDQKPEEWSMTYAKIAFAADILFPIACSVTKISLCLTYLRLFPSKTDKIFCYVLSVFVTLYTVACIFLMLFQCTPIRAYWDPAVKQHCINIRATLVSVAALNSLSDFLVYLWPAKPLWSLQLPLKQRLGLITIFGVGCTVCVAGICRMYYLEMYFESYDLLWEASIIYTTMSVEMNLGIICGCLSGVKPVLAVVFPRFFGTSHKTNSRPAYPTSYGRSTRPETFAFHPLSDVSNLSKSKDKDIGNKIDHAVSIENIRLENGIHKEQRNFAWASSSGECEIDPKIPANAIGVNQVVTVKEEELENIDGLSPGGDRNRKGDASSEEWIMEEFPQPGGKRRDS
ncbi:hypothetical protein B0J11DRAFT_256598 [Dendryphion nanum]|uniref:Rhodopsin domain-containing protein n=1 Tax=Dendryphion nanum TaxID=256645 RepID=A0A9P9E3Y1_9PLEO|nr:hypothetical protein B0J11DRAFT_256598 [Dendryphion nanum]